MIVFWLAPILAILTIFGNYAYGNLRKIEDNWSEHRCNPMYMPFAGMVDPELGAGGNFRSCLNLIGKSVVGRLIEVLSSQFSLIAGMLADITNPLALMRAMMNNMRQFIMSFAGSTLGKASGPVSMFVYYLNKIQDLIRRIVGEGYIATFFGITAVAFIQGFVFLIIGVIKAFVIAMLIISVILAMFNLPMLAIVLTIAASLAAAGA